MKKSAASWFIVGFFGFICLFFLFIAYLYFTLDNSIKDYYQVLTNTKKIVVQKPDLFLPVNAPTYIGQATPNNIIKKLDTLFIEASFHKGGGFDGETFFLVDLQNKQNNQKYWISEKFLMNVFEYTYAYQPLTFTLGGKKATQAWDNAQQYIELYKKYHKDDHTDTNINNDTLISVRYENYNGSKYLDIERHNKGDSTQFSVQSGRGRSGEKSIIKNLQSKNDNKPNNDEACAYFMMHNVFYREK